MSEIFKKPFHVSKLLNPLALATSVMVAGCALLEEANFEGTDLEQDLSAIGAGGKLDGLSVISDPLTGGKNRFRATWTPSALTGISGPVRYSLYLRPALGSLDSWNDLLLGEIDDQQTLAFALPTALAPMAEFFIKACTTVSPIQCETSASFGEISASSSVSYSTLDAATSYIKAGDAGAHRFGVAVALSSDGSVLVVGAPSADVSQSDPASPILDAGAAYVFRRTNGVWVQEAKLTANDSQSNAGFGESLTISGDGGTIAVAATSKMVSGFFNAGAVYVFHATAGAAGSATWSQAAKLVQSSPVASGLLGISLALSGSGDLLVAGAPYVGAGSVEVFQRTAPGTWGAPTTLTSSTGSAFGSALSIDSLGNLIAVGAENESVDGVSNSGKVYLFSRNAGGGFTEDSTVAPLSKSAGDKFGGSVSLSSDGLTLAVGARWEDSGDESNDTDNTASNAGASYIFTKSGSSWTQQAYLKSYTPSMSQDDEFGSRVSLSANGQLLLVTSPFEDSSGTGLFTSVDEAALQSGSATLFAKGVDSIWRRVRTIKATNTESADGFGVGAALSGDGKTIAVGAHQESSGATGIDGPTNNNSGNLSGAAYVY
jgi:hypothetical protein